MRHTHAILFALLITAPLAGQVDKPCPSTTYDVAPKLLTSIEPFKRAVCSQNCTGRVVFRLTVSDTGSVSDPKFISPVRLDFMRELKDRIGEWKFCPAVATPK